MQQKTHRSFYEEIFGDIELAVQSDKNPMYLLQQPSQQWQHLNIYLSCGVDDFLRNENQKMVTALSQARVQHTYEEWEGGHDWTFWDRSIERFLEWLTLPFSTEGMHSGHIKEE